MVGTSVDAIDDGIGCALQFIVEAARDQAADNGRVEALGRQHIGASPALDAAFCAADAKAMRCPMVVASTGGS